jgi:hypothetical protein
MNNLSLWAEKAYKQLHFYFEKYRGRVPEEWLAGIVYVECARLDPKAKRFEEKVYQSVLWVKKGNKSQSYPGFNAGPIHDLIVKTDDIAVLKSIATSYGHGQLMGYNYVTHLNWGPEHYINLSVEDSIQALCRFANNQYIRIRFPQLTKNGKVYPPYEQLLRMWNTGSPTGITKNADYVKNAASIAAQYRTVMERNKTTMALETLTKGDLSRDQEKPKEQA